MGMIKISGLKKYFGTKRVLDGVDLDIDKGKITVIIGRSGEGKSVLIKHIIGLVEEKLGRVGLVGVEHMMPAELSGGMKKRVGLARAIVMDPEIVLFDEPTTGLDPIMSDSIADLVLDTQRSLQTHYILITHDIPFPYKIADKIAMLHEGRIIEK